MTQRPDPILNLRAITPSGRDVNLYDLRRCSPEFLLILQDEVPYTLCPDPPGCGHWSCANGCHLAFCMN